MNSFLITGGTNKERLEKAKKLIKQNTSVKKLEPHPDLLMIQPELSISIKQIRELQKFLSRKPYQAEIKVVIMPEAEKMTLPAQNSFLKTLEEPPENSLIILCAQNQDQLLPTIISRCQLIKLIPKPEIELDKSLITHYSLLITQLLQAKVGKRLQLIEPYTKNREEAIKFCQEMIVVFRHKLLLLSKKKSSGPLITHYSLLITQLQKAIGLLNSNVNVKLTMENLVLTLLEPKSSY